MVLLPAFGYLPVLGEDTFHLEAWQALWARAGLHRSVLLSYFSGLITTLVALFIVMLFLAASQGTWIDRAIRRMVSPLLAIPHAAVAFGLAF